MKNALSKLSVAVLSICFIASFGAGVLAQEQVNEIERMKAQYGTEYSIADLAPTVCEAVGAETPKDATANKIQKVLEPMSAAFEGRKAQKVFIYCGDCIGDVSLRDYPEDFTDVLAQADAVVRSTNVMKTVTPVCYATIFSGAGPEVHGIRVYEKPVVKVDTLFDSFLRAGKKIAIVSRPGKSVITIFREREIDYYDAAESDAQAFEQALTLLREDYDLIVFHDCRYDSVMHSRGTKDERSLQARRDVLARWLKTIEETDDVWSGFDRLLVFAADHGSHTSEGTSKGAHGTDVYDDAVVNHFYRWRAASK